ncbi:MAG: hypothetical protein IJK71_06665 [Clostridia bacterium]|nr:hypothetical protein [Clostridia bacterium]
MAEQDKCVRCGAFLTKDETALTRKLINRGATEFFCLSCLASHFQLSEEILRKKIEEFKAMGCTLFNP